MASSFSKYWMVGSNFLTAAVWFRVLWVIVSNLSSLTGTNGSLSDEESNNIICREKLGLATNMALWVSMVEIVNCLLGFTKSPLPAVLLFSCTRMGVEKIVAPLISCSSWQHLITVFSWSLGDTIRFGTFAMNTAYPSLPVTKSIRFMVGPILFPIGAFGEMMMVVAAAQNGRPKAYAAAVLWPIFFYPMMKQLLKQRRKHFQSTKKQKNIKAVALGDHNKQQEVRRRSGLFQQWKPKRKDSFFSFTTQTESSMPKKSNKPKVYAVAVGRQPGIYHTWDECQAQVQAFSKAKFKSFPTAQDAQIYLQQHSVVCAINNNDSNGATNASNNNKNKRNMRPSDQDSNVPPSNHGKKRKVSDATAQLPSDTGGVSHTNDVQDCKEPLVLPKDSKIQSIQFQINFDGGSRGNPKGVAGSGAHVITRIHYEIVPPDTPSLQSSQHTLRRKADIRKYLGKGNMTNNQAEYLGAIAGLEHVLETLKQAKLYLTCDSTVTILVQGDSNLVIQQLLGNWQCKNENMQALRKQTKGVERDIERALEGKLQIQYEHVYRQDNAIADGLANAAMDAGKSWTTIITQEEGDDSHGKKMGKIILV
ncbi:phosphoglyceromutase [Nitzschia inconspicua]|uniref:Ribonuclease H n=1 Tax=Nitzschia inconspicua TaxID=303405 RepID=A0A9K3PX06_9STRA|nr:phosphoglyceromutase [Nitzschia inconspicua]